MSFLTDDELRTLTGYAHAAQRIRWLRARRVRHYVNGVGQPVVAWHWLDEPSTAAVAAQPNFDSIL